MPISEIFFNNLVMNILFVEIGQQCRQCRLDTNHYIQRKLFSLWNLSSLMTLFYWERNMFIRWIWPKPLFGYFTIFVFLKFRVRGCLDYINLMTVISKYHAPNLGVHIIAHCNVKVINTFLDSASALLLLAYLPRWYNDGTYNMWQLRRVALATRNSLYNTSIL